MGLTIALELIVQNYAVLTGSVSPVVNRLPWLLVFSTLVGFGYALWRHRARPDIYLRRRFRRRCFRLTMAKQNEFSFRLSDHSSLRYAVQGAVLTGTLDHRNDGNSDDPYEFLRTTCDDGRNDLHARAAIEAMNRLSSALADGGWPVENGEMRVRGGARRAASGRRARR